MAEPYAHTGSDPEDTNTWQLLSDHDNAVACQAAAFAAEFDMGVWGRALGLLHDAGKASEAFQRRLRGSAEHVDHATAGAKIAIERYGTCGRFMASLLVGHHGGMPNGTLYSHGLKGRGRTPLEARLKNEIEPYDGFFDLVRSGDIELPDPAELGLPQRPGREFSSVGSKAFSTFVLGRMLHSCLVDADYLDTERFMVPESAAVRDARELASMEDLFVRLVSYMDRLMADADDTPVNRARRSVYEDCLDAASWDSGLFVFTVPTGGGKTLSSIAFALRHAIEHGMGRVIVAIPFTSIVEQTAATLKKVFGSENVLEHHSNYDFGDLDDGERVQQRLAVQNWDAPIVVTTNVQLLESLFSNKPGKSRKVHNVANSVIILDEAQTLPDSLLMPSLAMLEELAMGYGSSIMLCTATQPALEGLWPFGGQPREIVRRREDFDEAFSGRVSYKTIGDIDEEDLVSRLTACCEVLCVVGTRKSARAVYDGVVIRATELGEILDPSRAFEEGFFHLSASMIPEHRSAMLERIRARLVNGERCVVVSTQLVEAGVDVDFPIVYRELAGLDSIVQAAGRCNREGERPEGGAVYLFECFIDGERQKNGPWLEKMKDIARDLIVQNDGVVDEGLVPRFFERRYSTEDKDAKCIFKALTSKDIIADRFTSMPYEQCALDYRVIDDDSVPVFVPWGDEGRKLLGEVLASDNPAGMAMRLQRFSVGVPPRYVKEYEAVHAVEMVEPFCILKEDGCRSFYREDVGLLSAGEETLNVLIG